jgi:hypothetical protein
LLTIPRPILSDTLSHETFATWVLLVKDGTPVAAGQIGQEDFGVGEAFLEFTQFSQLPFLILPPP